MFEFSLILGVLLSAIGLSVLFDVKQAQKTFKSSIENTGWLLLTAMFLIVLGVGMLTQEHILSFDLIGLFALIGWLILIKGLALLWFPTPLLSYGKKMIKKTNALQFGGLIDLLLGVAMLYLAYSFVAPL